VEEAWYGDVDEDKADSEGSASICGMEDMSNGERGGLEAQVLGIFSSLDSARHDGYTSISSDSLSDGAKEVQG
jgi:hypothetical protein